MVKKRLNSSQCIGRSWIIGYAVEICLLCIAGTLYTCSDAVCNSNF